MRILIISLFCLFSSFAFAVDGFQQLKFGASSQQVIQAYPQCEWQEDEDGSLYCPNFTLGNFTTEAWFYFLNKKFSRIGILLQDDQYLPTLKVLMNKYKVPSSAMSQRETENAIKNLIPEMTYDLFTFDLKTIILRLYIDAERKPTIWLIYSTSDFEDKLVKQNADSLQDQL